MIDPTVTSSLGLVLAYLDPGTGSLILQSIVAGILGAVIAVKVFWRRIVSFFRGETAVEEIEAPESGAPAEK